MNSESDMNGSHFTIFIFHQFESPMDTAMSAIRIQWTRNFAPKNWCALAECRPTVQRRLAATPSWLLFESDRVKYRYSQCIYNSWYIFFVCLFSGYAFSDVNPSIMRCCWATAERERERGHTDTQTLTRCHYNKFRCASKMIYCQNVGARGRCDVRESSKFMNVMHIDKRRRRAHTQWVNRIYECTRCVFDACIGAACEMCFCIFCVRVVAHPTSIHPSVRPFVRSSDRPCECIFGRLDDSVFMNFIWKWLW